MSPIEIAPLLAEIIGLKKAKLANYGSADRDPSIQSKIDIAAAKIAVGAAVNLARIADAIEQLAEEAYLTRMGVDR